IHPGAVLLEPALRRADQLRRPRGEMGRDRRRGRHRRTRLHAALPPGRPRTRGSIDLSRSREPGGGSRDGARGRKLESMVRDQPNQTLVYESGSRWPAQWIVQIDPVMKRLRLIRRRFRRWTKTLVDCSFDECMAVGTVAYHNEGSTTYG